MNKGLSRMYEERGTNKGLSRMYEERGTNKGLSRMYEERGMKRFDTSARVISSNYQRRSLVPSPFPSFFLRFAYFKLPNAIL